MNQSQSVLITGSSSGFGLLIARTLITHGYTVFATMREPKGRNSERANELRTFATEQASTLHILDLDVISMHSVETAVQKALELEGRIDVVVNNAGVGDGFAAYCEAISMNQFNHIFDVNVFGVQRVIRAVLPIMRRQGSGLLVNISSIMGRVVLPFAAPYTATKYALEALSESYRYELSGAGIDVVIVEPGGFGTEFYTKLQSADEPARMEGYGSLAELPQKMYGGVGDMLSGPNAPNPQDVANAVLRLIETKTGQRPLRTVIDPLLGGEGPQAINQMTDQIQIQLLAGFGMEQLLGVDITD
jgi:NAD(P)-dependent dehydrogenase (short-subunit alcohol dehydrogenase family)